MEIFNGYVAVLKQYTAFGGRARRKEYWLFHLVSVLICIALVIVDSITGTVSSSGLGLLSGLYVLATLLPSLSVSVRRLHDTNRSGWWILISLVPLIGPIVLLVFLVQDSQAETNPYGPNPKVSGGTGTKVSQL